MTGDEMLTLLPRLHLSPQEGHPLLNLLVVVCYALQTATVLLIVVQGFRHRSYGMPLWGIVSILGICIICGFIGPALQPHLFYRLVSFDFLHWMWRGWTLLMLAVFGQYVWWVSSHPRLWPQTTPYIKWLAIPLLVMVTYGEWTFIVFYQDVYINAIWPICILVMSINYVTNLFTRVKLRGLSIAVAWLWLVSNTFLYVGVVFGEIGIAYPCHDGTCALPCSQTDMRATCLMPAACGNDACGLHFDTGYAFIYFVYAVTLMANVFYAVELTRRRSELGPRHDVRETLGRMIPVERGGAAPRD